MVSTVTVPSTFPPERRPIYIYPVASMSRKTKDDAYPIMAEAVEKVVNKHPDDKVLVHTVSYDFTRYLQGTLAGLSSRLVAYHSAGDKQRAIDHYLYQPSSVLLAPSLDRGIDLPQDSCRAIVITKVPFPSLGDKQVSARLHSPGGQTWYNVRTIRSLVQMTGRGMRSEDDYCESYILDRNFLDMIWNKTRHLLPSWWKEALVWNKGVL
jgi:ATP-dependent DNA helicase DinG